MHSPHCVSVMNSLTNKTAGYKMSDKENHTRDRFKETGVPADPNLRSVWEAAGAADRLRSFDLPDSSDTDEALRELHIRLGFESRPAKISRMMNRYSKYLVAAVALLIFGAVLFFAPQNVTAPFGEITRAELADGTTVELNSGSTIQFSRLYGYTNRTISLNGEAWFDVENGSIPFIVKANGAVAEVTGTKFVVRSWSNDLLGETRLTVEEGSVDFFADGREETAVSLSEGRTTVWNPDRIRPADPQKADLEEATGWRKRMFIFYEEPLKRILHDVERRFDVDIVLENGDVAAKPLTGYYKEIDSAESLLEDICTVAGLKYARTANGFRVY